MGRFLLFIVLLTLLVAIVFVLATIVARSIAVGQNMFRPITGHSKEGLMVPTPFQKITYAALIVLLFGVATGWMGGL